MPTTGRIFQPCNIDDHLSDEQITRFATLLAECVERSWGKVTITVRNGHVDKVLITHEYYIREDIKEKPMANPDFGKR